MLRFMLLSFGIAVFAVPSLHGQTLASVCPDDPDVFPAHTATTTPNKRIDRPVFRASWQRDYPTLVYDAARGKRYWVEYQNSGPVLLELTTSFAPITYTSEKILVRICGLHFHSEVTAAAVTQAVPDGGPQIADVLPTISSAVKQDLNKPLVDIIKASEYSWAIPNLPVLESHATTDHCAELNQRLGEAAKYDSDYQAALSELKRIIQSLHLGLEDGSSFSFKKLEDRTREVLAAQPIQGNNDAVYTDLTQFETSLVNTTGNLKLLNDAVKNYNSGITSKTFKDAWTDLNEKLGPIKTEEPELKRIEQELRASGDPADLACLQGIKTDWLAKLDADIEQFGELQTRYIAAYKHFANTQNNLIQSFDALNYWYAHSSISTTRYLDPVAKNSLTQIAISVTDPWRVLESPNFVAVEVVKPNGKKPGPPKPTTIEITDAKKQKSTITIQPGDAGTASSSSAPDGVSIAVVPDASAQQSTPKQSPTVTVNIVAPLGGKPASDKTTANDKAAAPATQANVDASAIPKKTLPDSTTFLERHRWINFVPSGGLLVTRVTQQSFNTETLPTSIVTTVTTVSDPTSTPPTVTITPSSGTATYAYKTFNGPFQQAAVAGFTWYPWGRDTYPILGLSSGGYPSGDIYAQHRVLSKSGLFIGTSVSSVGTFTVGPTFELKPGIQLFAGVSLQQKNQLAQNIVTCDALGSSTSTSTSKSSVTSGTGVTTTTTVTVQTTSGCATPNVTNLSGTTVPTNTVLKPAFSFGIMLNTNLMKTLGFH